MALMILRTQFLNFKVKLINKSMKSNQRKVKVNSLLQRKRNHLRNRQIKEKKTQDGDGESKKTIIMMMMVLMSLMRLKKITNGKLLGEIIKSKKRKWKKMKMRALKNYKRLVKNQ